MSNNQVNQDRRVNQDSAPQAQSARLTQPVQRQQMPAPERVDPQPEPQKEQTQPQVQKEEPQSSRPNFDQVVRQQPQRDQSGRPRLVEDNDAFIKKEEEPKPIVVEQPKPVVQSNKIVVQQPKPVEVVKQKSVVDIPKIAEDKVEELPVQSKQKREDIPIGFDHQNFSKYQKEYYYEKIYCKDVLQQEKLYQANLINKEGLSSYKTPEENTEQENNTGEEEEEEEEEQIQDSEESIIDEEESEEQSFNNDDIDGLKSLTINEVEINFEDNNTFAQQNQEHLYIQQIDSMNLYELNLIYKSKRNNDNFSSSSTQAKKNKKSISYIDYIAYTLSESIVVELKNNNNKSNNQQETIEQESSAEPKEENQDNSQNQKHEIILAIFDQSKQLLGYSKLDIDKDDRKTSSSIYPGQLIEGNLQLDNQQPKIGDITCSIRQSFQKYNNKSQIKLEKARFSFNNPEIQKPSNLNYYITLDYSFQKFSYRLQKFKSEIENVLFYFLFNPRETKINISLWECEQKNNGMRKIGGGELSIKQKLNDISVDISNSTTNIATFIIDIDTPYTIQDSQNNAKRLAQQNSKLKQSEIIQKPQKSSSTKNLYDSAIQSPNNQSSVNQTLIKNASVIIDRKPIIKNNMDLSSKNVNNNQPFSFFDQKIKSPYLAQINLNKSKLQPLNHATSSKNLNLKRNEFVYPSQIDEVQIGKKFQLNKQILSRPQPEPLSKDPNLLKRSLILNSNNSNNLLTKNQSSILLNKQFSSPQASQHQQNQQPQQLNKVQSVVKKVNRSSFDNSINKNFNIISNLPEERSGNGAIKESISQVMNNIANNYKQNIKNNIHKKKFSNIRKLVNHFKEQEKYDQDKTYDLGHSFFNTNDKITPVQEMTLDQSPSTLTALPVNVENTKQLTESKIEEIKENLIDERSKSRQFIETNDEQKERIKEYRNKVLQEQKQNNLKYLYTKIDAF